MESFLRTHQQGCIHVPEFNGPPSAGDQHGTPAGHERLRKALRYSQRWSRSPPRCDSCSAEEGWKGRLHMCLHCVFVGCLGGAHKHLEQHAAATGHFMMLDITHRTILCTKCGDYVYDPGFERVVRQERGRAVESRLPDDGRRAPYTPWTPGTSHEWAALKMHARDGAIVSSSYRSVLGLRGLHNLGNTCFANCIMQALTHNPLLRNYFMAGKHLRTPRCLRRAENLQDLKVGDRVEGRWRQGAKWFPGKVIEFRDSLYSLEYDDGDIETEVQRQFVRLEIPKAKAGLQDNSCLGCIVNNIYNEMYSEDPQPFAPFRLLHSVWLHSRHLAGYAQQDAHEFFIALLDGLHNHCGGKPSADCDCIIHRIFTGAMQSDVTCQACGSVSTTVDPFWDISLHLTPTADSGPLTLIDCLKRFTRTEHLGADAKVKCDSCHGWQEATKRLSLKKLPVVICFHMKRFEHTVDASNKIGTFVKFTESLDLRRYLSHHIGEDESKVDPGAPVPGCGAVQDNYEYSLFSVVNHHGSLSNGHYTCYVKLARQGGQWFRCNDETITCANLKDVLDSQGYMLFYIKTRLEYSQR